MADGKSVVVTLYSCGEQKAIPECTIQATTATEHIRFLRNLRL